MAPRPATHRISARPDAAYWADDELITLAECVGLCFKHGPFDTAALRRAIRSGELAAVTMNGKAYTTMAAVRSWSLPRLVTPDNGSSTGIDVERKLLDDLAAATSARARDVKRPRHRGGHRARRFSG